MNKNKSAFTFLFLSSGLLLLVLASEYSSIDSISTFAGYRLNWDYLWPLELYIEVNKCD